MYDSQKWHHEYYKKYRTVRSAYNKQYQKDHRQEQNKRAAAYVQRLRGEVFKKLGGRCSSAMCRWLNEDGSEGCLDERCLQIDHVFDDGYKDRQQQKSPTMVSIYRKVLADTIGRYQLLCANCNWLKRWAHDEQRRQARDVSGN